MLIPFSRPNMQVWLTCREATNLSTLYENHVHHWKIQVRSFSAGLKKSTPKICSWAKLCQYPQFTSDIDTLVLSAPCSTTTSQALTTSVKTISSVRWRTACRYSLSWTLQDAKCIRSIMDSAQELHRHFHCLSLPTPPSLTPQKGGFF